MSSPLDHLTAALADRYRLEGELGAGGMATVYLAHDLKHDRRVAVKVLRPELAAVIGAERFLAEIKTTANLQHPHILPLFDSGQVTIGNPEAGEGSRTVFYVMPFVEGESLRDRLATEKQLPVAEAVRIAREIAGALDYAHRHGVIHRDIKPENILLHDGQALVADFGIALAASKTEGGSRMTETGMSLGTPHYMSPEQAMGQRDLDARTDVYALGCVLYEMLAGEPPFSGPSPQAIVAKVMTSLPVQLSELRATVPTNVVEAVHAALQKLPADRFATASALAAALNDPGYGQGRTQAGPSGSRGSRRLTLLLGGVAAAALVAAGWGWLRPMPTAPVVRYQFALPANQMPVPGAGAPTPAPDGSFLVFQGLRPDGAPGHQLWIKRRDRQEATPIPGTEDANHFAISPDGNSIVFDAVGTLRRISIEGGAVVTLVPGFVFLGATVAWLEDETIIYAASANGVPYLWTVQASGGTPAPLFPSDTIATAGPAPIWGTSGMLFARCRGIGECDIWGLDRRTNASHLVVPNAFLGAVAPSGHLVYLQGNRLMGVRFDPERLETRGEPISLADSVGGLNNGPGFRLSRSGTLVTTSGGGTLGQPFEMVWVDRSGAITPVDTTWRFRLTVNATNHGWALSPDGSRLAIGLNTGTGDDIWVKQLPRGPLQRVSFDPTADARPRWHPDGRSVTYIGSRDPNGIYLRRADGTGTDSLLIGGAFDEAGLSPDAKWLLLRQGANGSVAGGRDITGLRIGVDSTAVPILDSNFDEMAPMLSPDGQWLAYQSDETGTTEVFLRGFPDVGAFKRQVSNGGGEAPLWSRNGRELFYLSRTKDMMVVRVASGPQPTLSEPEGLFRVPPELLGAETAFYTPWDVARDGRFIMARLVQTATGPTGVIVVAENWLSELKALLP